MKPFSNSSLVDEAASELERIAPKNSQVEIDVIEDPIGNFSTHIKLHTKSKTYFAKKDDTFLYRSCYKAIRAIKAQIKKKRTSHLHQHVSIKHT